MGKARINVMPKASEVVCQQLHGARHSVTGIQQKYGLIAL